MSIKATNEQKDGGNFTPVPVGNHVMRCFKMIEIGTFTGQYKGEDKIQRRVWLEWELPNKQHEFKPGSGLKPFAIGKEFSLTMYETSKLRLFLEGWRNKKFTEEEAKEFDVTKVLGKPCMGSVVEEETGKTKIVSVSSLPDGFVCPPQVNSTILLSYDNFDFNIFNSLPKWLKEKIMTTPEYDDVYRKNEAYEFEKSQLNQSDADVPF